MFAPRLHLFGPPRIEIDGHSVPFHRSRALALVACLAVAREPQSRNGLLALLWPAFDTASARNNLRRELSHLRSLLGADSIVAGRDAVALDLAAIHVDAWEFEKQLATVAGHATSHPGTLCDFCAAHLDAALATYTADFLDGFGLPDSPPFDEWQSLARDRLRWQAIEALERLAAWHAARAEHDRAAALAQRLLLLEPLHEPAHRILMGVLEAAGQRPAALRHYDSFRDRLAQDVGAEPEAATTALRDAIRRGAAPAGASPQPAGESVIHLPAFSTPFVGRENTLATVSGLLAAPETRLLTLTGPGGMGKTRLAVEAARRLAGLPPENGRRRFADGIFFVSLAGLTTAEAIPAVVAEVLGFTIRGDGPPSARQLLDFFYGRQLLVVLDNIEHLLPGGEVFPAQIIREAPGVTLMVTSRERLNISGERLFPVGGMDVPPESDHQTTDGRTASRYSSVALFLQTAQRVQPGFHLTPDNVEEVARICRRLGGMPLAIEMAAAWLEALTPAEIVAEIGHDLDFLATDLSDVPNRQRSIRAVFDTSFRLLNERERVALPRLAVFVDGFTRDAAEAVVASEGGKAFLQTLLGLAHKSWLTRDGSGRFQIHELLQQYALEQLGGERPNAQERHARYYARFLDELWPNLYGGDQLAVARAIAADLNNVLAAWMWFARRGEIGPIAHQMLMPLVYFTIITLWFDNYARLLDQTIGDAPPETSSLDLLILRAARAVFEINLWSADTSLEPVWQSVSQLTDPANDLGVWYILLCEGYGVHIDKPTGSRELRRLVARYEPDDNWLLHYAQRSLGKLVLADWRDAAEQAEAIDLLWKAATGFRQSGNILFQGLTLIQIARNSGGLLAPEERLKLLDQIRALLESVGRPGHTWDYAWHRMGIHIRLSSPEQVFADLEEQLAIARSRGERLSQVQTLAWDSTYARRYHSIDHSLRSLLDAIAIAEKVDMPMMLGWSLWNMGEIQRMMGDWRAASDYIGRSKRIFAGLNDLMGLSYVEFGYGSLALDEGDLVTARKRLERFVELSWPLPQNRWNQANGLVWLARADVALGRLEQAAQELREAMRLIVIGQDYDVAPGALAAVAELALGMGRADVCAALCAYLLPMPQTWLETRGQLEKLAAQAGEQDEARAIAHALPDLETLIARIADLPGGPAAGWLDGIARLGRM